MTKQKTKTYKLLSMNLKVVYKDKVEDEDGCWNFGHVSYDGNNATIEISTTSREGRKLTKEELDNTLRHELFHFILETLYYRDLSANETLVEYLANATTTLNKQGLNI